MIRPAFIPANFIALGINVLCYGGLIGFGSEAFAAGGQGIPFGTIAVQAFNLSVLLGVLIYLVGPKLQAHFAQRAQAFDDLARKAEEARKQAEEKCKQIAQKLSQLESQRALGIEEAKKNASALREDILEDARRMVLRLEKDTQQAIWLATQSARSELKRELLERSLEESRKLMGERLAVNGGQSKLYDDFVEKIQVVS